MTSGSLVRAFMRPSDGYITYIINPKSGASSRKLASRQFQHYLRARGYDVRTHTTTSLRHACELATSAAGDPACMLVVAAGGDGTVREVARGLEGSDTALLLAPSGTENLLANELGFDRRVETLISAFEGGTIRNLDLCTADGKCDITGCYDYVMKVSRCDRYVRMALNGPVGCPDKTRSRNGLCRQFSGRIDRTHIRGPVEADAGDDVFVCIVGHCCECKCPSYLGRSISWGDHYVVHRTEGDRHRRGAIDGTV